MSYKEEVVNFLNENTDLKPLTVKLYSIKLNQLHNDLGIKYTESFKDYNKIFNYIKDFSNSNKISFISSIITVLKDKKLIKIYQEQRNVINKIKNDNYENNTKSDNFVDYDTLFNLYTKPDFSEDINIVLNRMLMYIAIRYPMRNDLANIEVAKKKSDMVNPNTNYLNINTKNAYFYMNKFKNVSSMGKMVVPIEKEDQKVIREYFKFLKKHKIESNKFLLTYHGGVNEFPTNDAFGRKLRLIFSYNFPKNNLSMNDIRKAYETKHINSEEYRTMTNKEKNIIHHKILHSMGVAHEVYNQV